MRVVCCNVSHVILQHGHMWQIFRSVDGILEGGWVRRKGGGMRTEGGGVEGRRGESGGKEGE